MPEVGKLLFVLGVTIALLGLLLWFGRWPLGRLPGDIFVEKEHFRFYFPLVTSLLLSLLLTALLWFLRR